MVDYWIDSSVLINAKNQYYGFNRVPAFWRFLDEKGAAGTIAIPELVYDEIVKIDDELSEWVKDRRNSGLIVPPSPDVQAKFREVSDHIVRTYDPDPRKPNPHVPNFLAGADPWLIAYGAVEGGCVVTRESKIAPGAKRPKIPNIGANFKVPVKDLFEMLDDLKPSF